MRRLRFQRGVSALLRTLTLLFLLGGLLSLLGTTLLSQLNALLAAAPAFFDAIPAAAENLLARLERFHAGGPDWLTAYLQGQLLQTVNDMDSLLRSLSSRAVAALAQAAAALPGGLLAVATCVLAIFFKDATTGKETYGQGRFLDAFGEHVLPQLDVTRPEPAVAIDPEGPPEPRRPHQEPQPAVLP